MTFVCYGMRLQCYAVRLFYDMVYAVKDMLEPTVSVHFILFT